MSRLIHARLLLAIAIAVTIGGLELGSLMTSNSQAPIQPQITLSPVDSVPMLATIRVSAPELIPTLPLVIVRPDADQRFEEPAQVRALVLQHRSNSRLVDVGTTPHVRLDMPYYSFGKMLPNVIKD